MTDWIAWVIRHPGKADEFLILSEGPNEEFSDWIWPPLISDDSYEVTGFLLFDDARANQLLRDLNFTRVGEWNRAPEGYWVMIEPVNPPAPLGEF